MPNIISTNENLFTNEIDLMAFNENEIIQYAEKQCRVLEGLIKIAIKRTNEKDWVSIGDKPYLGASGTEKLMALFGINITNTHFERYTSEDSMGKYYYFTYTGTFSWKMNSFECIGTCSQRDKFFSYDSASKGFKETLEIDETNIKKAAYSNMLCNGVSKILGLRNLTWDQLKEYGIDRSKLSNVSFKNTVDVSDEMKTQQQELRQKILTYTDNDLTKASELLKEMSSFTTSDGKVIDGKAKVEQLTAKQLPRMIKTITEMLASKGVSNA